MCVLGAIYLYDYIHMIEYFWCDFEFPLFRDRFTTISSAVYAILFNQMSITRVKNVFLGVENAKSKTMYMWKITLISTFVLKFLQIQLQVHKYFIDSENFTQMTN